MKLDKFFIGLIICVAVFVAFISGYVETLNNYGIVSEDDPCGLSTTPYLNVKEDVDGAMDSTGAGTATSAILDASSLSVGMTIYQTKDIIPTSISCVANEFNLQESPQDGSFSFPWVGILVTILSVTMAFAVWREVTLR